MHIRDVFHDDLWKPKQIHNGTKKYKCTQCNSQFSKNTDQKAHIENVKNAKRKRRRKEEKEEERKYRERAEKTIIGTKDAREIKKNEI